MNEETRSAIERAVQAHTSGSSRFAGFDFNSTCDEQNAVSDVFAECAFRGRVELLEFGAESSGRQRGLLKILRFPDGQPGLDPGP